MRVDKQCFISLFTHEGIKLYYTNFVFQSVYYMEIIYLMGSGFLSRNVVSSIGYQSEYNSQICAYINKNWFNARAII